MHSPGFEIVDGIFYTSLVVSHHVLMHVGIVASYVLLRAPVRDGAEAQGRILLCGLLELKTTEEDQWEILH